GSSRNRCTVARNGQLTHFARIRISSTVLHHYANPRNVVTPSLALRSDLGNPLLPKKAVFFVSRPRRIGAPAISALGLPGPSSNPAQGSGTLWNGFGAANPSANFGPSWRKPTS